MKSNYTMLKNNISSGREVKSNFHLLERKANSANKLNLNFETVITVILFRQCPYKKAMAH